MTQEYPILTISGDLNGRSVTGVFEMQSADVEPGIENAALFNSSGGLVQGLRTKATDSRRSQVSIDGGAGVEVFNIQFAGWEGSDGQWGDDSTKQLTASSATGQEPVSQISVLQRYLVEIDIGSENPATLEWGEYSDSGVYGPKDVAVRNPTLPKSREQSSSFSGSLSLYSVDDLNGALGRLQDPF